MIAKEKGPRGLEDSSEYHIRAISLMVQIPEEIVNYMGLSKGKEIRILPEEKSKMVIGVDT